MFFGGRGVRFSCGFMFLLFFVFFVGGRGGGGGQGAGILGSVRAVGAS